MRLRTLAVLLPLALAAPGLAHAQDDAAEEQRAKELFYNGRDLYNEGLYQEAILAFEESYRLSGRHELLLNIASAQERLGQVQEAVDTLNRYRAYAPADEREALERRIRNLERRLAEEAENQPPEPVAQPAPAQPDPVPVPVKSPVTRQAPRWGLVAGGAATAIGFGATAAATWGLSRTWIAEGDQETYEAVRPFNNASLALVGVGGGVAVLGLVLRKEVPLDASASVVLWATPQDEAMVFGARFTPPVGGVR
ncbi:MAG: hypothetical protein H6739_28585 [Alphaproteobacteria bacterium]|nr:hypothetical protein [Alphaproteobacteria bacterium]